MILGAAIVARDVTQQRRRERDLGLVVSVTDALMGAVDVGAALGGLAERCVQDLGDWCAVYQLEEGSDLLRPVAMRQRDGRHGHELATLLAQRPARAGEGFAGAAMRAGETMLLPDLSEETLRRHAGNGVEAQIARRARPALDRRGAAARRTRAGWRGLRWLDQRPPPPG